MSDHTPGFVNRNKWVAPVPGGEVQIGLVSGRIVAWIDGKRHDLGHLPGCRRCAEVRDVALSAAEHGSEVTPDMLLNVVGDDLEAFEHPHDFGDPVGGSDG